MTIMRNLLQAPRTSHYSKTDGPGSARRDITQPTLSTYIYINTTTHEDKNNAGDDPYPDSLDSSSDEEDNGRSGRGEKDPSNGPTALFNNDEGTEESGAEEDRDDGLRSEGRDLVKPLINQEYFSGAYEEDLE